MRGESMPRTCWDRLPGEERAMNRDQMANKLADLQLTWAEKRIKELEAALREIGKQCASNWFNADTVEAIVRKALEGSDESKG